jgi:hypothetical protein
MKQIDYLGEIDNIVWFLTSDGDLRGWGGKKPKLRYHFHIYDPPSENNKNYFRFLDACDLAENLGYLRRVYFYELNYYQ